MTQQLEQLEGSTVEALECPGPESLTGELIFIDGCWRVQGKRDYIEFQVKNVTEIRAGHNPIIFLD